MRREVWAASGAGGWSSGCVRVLGFGIWEEISECTSSTTTMASRSKLPGAPRCSDVPGHCGGSSGGSIPSLLNWLSYERAKVESSIMSVSMEVSLFACHLALLANPTVLRLLDLRLESKVNLKATQCWAR
jgi:hypothetical protein